MACVWVLNGPNLQALGRREPAVYGTATYDELCRTVTDHGAARGVTVECRQTNSEGQLIDWLYEAERVCDGVILNAGAYTHYSYALRDAVAAVRVPVVEVHLTDITAREPFRRLSVLSEVCCSTVMGHGIAGYCEALDILLAGR